jgi:hypothetical protein
MPVSKLRRAVTVQGNDLGLHNPPARGDWSLVSGLWPLPHSESCKGSVAALADSLLSLRIQHLTLPGVRPHLDSHRPCGLGHEDSIKSVLEHHFNLSSHSARGLIEQAIKSGAYKVDKFKPLMEQLSKRDRTKLDELLLAKNSLREGRTHVVLQGEDA